MSIQERYKMERMCSCTWEKKKL